MKNVKKTNWRVYVRDHIYLQSITAYLDLLLNPDLTDYPYFARHYEVMSFVGRDFWWARDLDQLEKDFRIWLKSWKSRPAVLRSFINAFQKSVIDIRRDIPVLMESLRHPQGLSDKQLLDIYNRAKELFWNNIQYSEYGIDLFDDFFDKVLLEQFGDGTIQKIDPHDLVQLMRPAYASVVMQHKLALDKLSFKKSVTERSLAAIAAKYSWIMMSWDGSHELTVQQVRRDMRACKQKSVVQRKNEIKEMVGYTKKILRERKRLFALHNLPKQLAWYCTLLDKFAELHDFRKESQMRNSKVIFSSLHVIAKRFEVKFQDLVYYFNDEIERLCLDGKKVLGSTIALRKQGVTIVVNNKKVSLYFGERAYNVVKKLVLDLLRSHGQSVVRGIPAQPGLVHGKVFVTGSAKDANKNLRKGMILVASMTTVDYVPAMHRAAAIVTDDGGLACHAAIVARELGVPCVVGTKNATQAFKTGERVEVDATHGKVKKL